MTFQWYYLVGCFVAGVLLGAVVVRKFGANWLAILSWLVGKEEIAALARLAWEAGLIADFWKRARFNNDIELFVAWVLEQWEKLSPTEVTQIARAARRLQLQAKVGRNQ